MMNVRHKTIVSKARGFTLLELMIVVVIVAILSAIALPSYNDYVRRSRAAEGISALASWGTRLEQFYLDNRNYGAGGCGVAAPSAKYFTLTCNLTNGGQGYTATATATLNNEGTYSLSEGNQTSTTVFKGASVAKNCWLVKGDEC